MKKVYVSLFSCLLCLSMVVLLVPGCGPAEEAAPIKIGCLLTYTGGGVPYGDWFENGLNLKLDEVGGEVAGRPIELIMEDSAFDPTVAVDKARKLIEHDQVDAIIGGLNGAVAIAVAEYTKESGIPYAPFVDNSVEALYTGGNNVVMPWGSLRGGTYIVGQYAYDVLGFRTAATLRTDFVAGDQFIEGWEIAFEERGGTIIQRQAVPLGTLDYAPFVTALEEADCVAIWFTENAPFVRQFYEFGLDTPIVMASQGGMIADEMLLMGDNAVGIVTGAHEWLDNPDPATRNFVDGYTERYGALPTQPRYTVSAHVVLTAFLEAIKATGGDTTPAKLNDALKNVKVETATGVLSFDEQGFGIGDFHIIEWVKEDGTYYWKMVKRYDQIVKKAPGE
jgi:branched-chain amino acid transport system substrate-binding protein